MTKQSIAVKTRDVWVAACLLAVGLGVFGSAQRLGAQEAREGRYILTLHDALLQEGKAGGVLSSRPLNVYVTLDKGVWSDGWGESQNFNKAIHEAKVVEANVAGDKLRLKLVVKVYPDAWIKGGLGNYEVEINRAGAKLEGAFQGTFASTTPGREPFPAKGAVVGEWLPPQVVDPQWKPFEIGEHPRMLCRKFQIPTLQEKAKTPFGQAMMEIIKARKDAVSLGFMYQMTGDRAYADQAYQATLETMANRNGGAFALGRFWGYRTSVVGTAYDLCYDAWTAEQRDEVQNYLDWILYKCLHRGHRVGTVNWQPGSNYTVVIHAGNGMGALALWGEKGPGPLSPIAPRTAPAKLAGDYEPPQGVPVNKLVSGQMPPEWLGAGPFRARVRQHMHPYYLYDLPIDCLESIGGCAKARPTPGQKVEFRKQSLAWEAINLSAGKKDWDGKTKLSPSLLKAKDEENCFFYFYTVVETPKAGYYKVEASFYEGQCYIGGERFGDGEFVYLEKGRYPLLAPMAMGDGEYRATVALSEATEEQAKAYYADPVLKTAYENDKKTFEQDLARWKAGGERDLEWMRFSDAYRHLCYLCLQLGMGDGGFQAEGEGYTLECHHVLHDYACMYQNAFGRSLTGRPDISHFVPRYVFMALWDGDKVWQQSFGGHGGGSASPRYFARAISLCPKEWQPAVLWHWLKLMKVSPEDVESGAGVKKAFSGGEFDEGLELVAAFVNYPLGVKPQEPGQLMPHVWHAAGKGLAAFRNNWNGSDSIVAQAYAKQSAAGWNQAEAGCFQIAGLGVSWAAKTEWGKTATRWLDNAIVLPDDPFDAWGHGKIVYFQGDEKTGSGVTTIDMNDVYMGLEPADKNKKRVDIGIKGLRSFGADFSGKSGAPGLIAVVDEVTGGKRKVWVHQLPKAALSIEADGFTFKSGAASYKATFVSPKNVKISQAKGQGAQKISEVPDYDAQVLQVTGPTGQEGDFFVVITMQKGEAPAVKSTGDGLNAKVTVGGQTVGFDGQKIVFGP